MLFETNALSRPARAIAPGIAHIPNFVGLQQQEDIVGQIRNIAREVSKTPVAMTKPVLRSGGQMSVYMLHLGYFFDYDAYRYVSSKAGVPAPVLPLTLAQLGKKGLMSAAALAPELSPWATTFEPDMALVNYYPPGAHMGMHQDFYERTSAPIVSVSIGDEALFRIGSTTTRAAPWDEVTLSSGDLIVFGGPKRLAFHGVPKTTPHTAPAGCGVTSGRINITSRQVYQH
ncbi:MAG: alpha-ketoglutarate-dependent dioxygenase AlkB [Corynebacterium sp.]|nr:alpha-ketoglutarate-dependent dioxygenase AlkB [Corynebacterium sp.]